MKCPACGTGTPRPHELHLVWRWFKNWSGVWKNSVACDGKNVTGYATREEAEVSGDQS